MRPLAREELFQTADICRPKHDKMSRKVAQISSEPTRVLQLMHDKDS